MQGAAGGQNGGYDYLGRRVYKQVRAYWDDNPDPQVTHLVWTTIEERRFVWDGEKMLAEIDELNEGGLGVPPARQFTWGLDLAGQNGAVNSLEGAGTIGGLLAVHQEYEDHVLPDELGDVAAGDYIFFYDGNGNVGQLVDYQDLGTEDSDYTWDPVRLAAAYEYDPYGAASALVGDYAKANRFLFSTKPFDPETGFGVWHYRIYSPRLGRWISRDPIGERGGVNLYGYVGNCATVVIDPVGLKTYVATTPCSKYMTFC